MLLNPFRAGLLTKQQYPVPLNNQLQSRHIRSASALIQSNRQLHKLNLDLQKIKDTRHDVEKNKPKTNHKKDDEQIKFELRLNKTYDYERSKGSKIQIYTHKNTLPNFYTSVVNNSLKNVNNSTNLYATRLKVKNLISVGKRKYMSSSVVLMYQHEPGGHFFKDCYKYVTLASNKSVSPGISASYRKEWEAKSQQQKDHYKYLYGGVSFGICEMINHKCLYSIFVSHPIDRLLQTYNLCKRDSSKSFCHFHKLNLKKMSLYDFIKVQGNRLFQRLLYYNKHCRLLGEDEICLQDIKTSFVLTNKEYKVHLHNVLQNIENWFAVIGLTDYFDQSLAVFDSVLNLNMSAKCRAYWKTPTKSKRYLRQREKLLADKNIRKWLQADLLIYEKLTQVFHKQLKFMHLHDDIMNKTVIHSRKITHQRPVRSHLPKNTITHIKYGKQKEITTMENKKTRVKHTSAKPIYKPRNITGSKIKTNQEKINVTLKYLSGKVNKRIGDKHHSISSNRRKGTMKHSKDHFTQKNIHV